MIEKTEKCPRCNKDMHEYKGRYLCSTEDCALFAIKLYEMDKLEREHREDKDTIWKLENDVKELRVYKRMYTRLWGLFEDHVMNTKSTSRDEARKIVYDLMYDSKKPGFRNRKGEYCKPPW